MLLVLHVILLDVVKAFKIYKQKYAFCYRGYLLWVENAAELLLDR